MTEVRTRFAPSPTGLPHMGIMRTAFYAYLFAKHHGGKFLLRVEDTDQERKVPGSVQALLKEFAWLGIVPDEAPSRAELEAISEKWEGMPDIGGPYGPYVQSLRRKRYREVAEQLIASGHCYRCDCTPEMLEKERAEQMARKELPGYRGYCRTRNVPADKPHVVRFKMPYKVTVVLDDLVKGRVTWDNIPLNDPVLLKSDGLPTYHLAVVIDDTDMKISHVFRADEWLPSAPLHVLLYDALGWQKPLFGHLPQVMGSDGKKLSKRRGASSSQVFREEGYLPDALMNYVTLVGWSPGEGEEQEIFTKEELIKRFHLEGISRSSGVFDYTKLLWMNGMYIRNMPVDTFIESAKPFMGSHTSGPGFESFKTIAPLVQERVKTLKEVLPMVEFLFQDKVERDLPSMMKQGIDAAKAKEILDSAIAGLNSLSTFDHASIAGVLRPMAEKFGLKVGPLFGVVRVAVTGKGVTPPLFESLAALGKEKTVARLTETLRLLGA